MSTIRCQGRPCPSQPRSAVPGLELRPELAAVAAHAARGHVVAFRFVGLIQPPRWQRDVRRLFDEAGMLVVVPGRGAILLGVPFAAGHLEQERAVFGVNAYDGRQQDGDDDRRSPDGHRAPLKSTSAIVRYPFASVFATQLTTLPTPKSHMPSAGDAAPDVR